jgi:lysophospholipid acyltransferase (LPLAT)-like uncharacterized protein
MMKKFVLIAVVILVLLVLAGCAAETNSQVDTPAAEGKPAGFLLGLWHGFISPVTFIISLFSKLVGIYEIHNNGNWYNFGFVLGCAVIYGGGILGARRRR